MPPVTTGRFRAECDGCGAPSPSSSPSGWFARALDPPCYAGPRQILFCPRCFAELPARLRRRWRRLEAPMAESRLTTMARRLLAGSPRRGTVG